MSTRNSAAGEPFDVLVCVRELLLLRLLRDRELNAWQLKGQLAAASGSVLAMAQAPLYLALHRLVVKGFVTSESLRDDRNHRVKIYRLTEAGQKRLDTEAERWDQFASAVATILGQVSLPSDRPLV